MTFERTITIKVPGKVVVNGSYIVLNKETASVYTIDKYLHVKSSFKRSAQFSFKVKGRTEFLCLYDQDFTCPAPNLDSQFLLDIVRNFYKTTGVLPKNSFSFELNFDDGFFVGDGVKMGIGSSACILVSIVYSLFLLNETEISSKHLKDCPKNLDGSSSILVNLVYAINKKINPRSSGCDVMACLCGSINFNTQNFINIVSPCKYLILGTLGKSTCTRSAILNLRFQDSNWKTLANVNREILNHQQEHETESLCERYLDVLHSISRKIVPDAQYTILKKTFQYEIYGCGISGAGGEDAVWCMTSNVDDVLKYWKSEFKHVRVTRIVEKGVVEE